MTGLDRWLEEATRGLAKDSAAQVRREIQEHYDSARAAASDDAALAALGSAQTANREYRKVLLTVGEMRLLNQGSCEARAIGSRPLLKGLLLAIPAAALLASAVLFFRGANADLSRTLLAGGMALLLLLGAPFLPMYTPVRGRIYRSAKWLFLGGILAFLLSPDPLKWMWLAASCMWPVFWSEWRRVQIRRKLPVSRWPKHLYL